MSELATWLMRKTLTQAVYKKLVIAFLDDVVRPLAQKTDTQFDDNAVNAIIEALKD